MSPLHRPIAAAFVLATLSTIAAAQVNITWVTVGDAGNADQAVINGFAGGVADEYRISAYEITNAQYADFLNSVAATDSNFLYNTSMGSNARGGITRSGSPGSYSYAVKPNMGDKPVNFVSWYDVARFCNWLHNGQPAGTQNPATTEDGSYQLTGPASGGAKRPGATVTIPTIDQLHKAAFYDPTIGNSNDALNYWTYATRSNSTPTPATADAVGNVSNPGPNVANYDGFAIWNGVDNVTTVGSASNTSYYGAYDMAGNVGEWSDSVFMGLYQFLPGSLVTSQLSLRSDRSLSNLTNFSTENLALGFRVVTLPEQADVGMTIQGNPIRVGDRFVLEITARNDAASMDTATDVTLTVDYPAGWAFIKAAGVNVDSVVGNTLTLSLLVDLAPGETEDVIVLFVPSTVDRGVFDIEIASAQVDPNTANNTVTTPGILVTERADYDKDGDVDQNDFSFLGVEFGRIVP